MNEITTKSLLLRLSQPVGTVAVIILLVLTGAVTLRNIRTLGENTTSVQMTYEFLGAIDRLESSLKDAEAGQRGYIITGNPSDLEPYQAANERLDLNIAQLLDQAKHQNNPSKLMESLIHNVQKKRDALSLALIARDEHGFEAAKEIINTDAGKSNIDELRETFQNMRSFQTNRLADLKKQSNNTYRTAWYTGLLSTIAGIGLVGGVLRAVHRRRVTAECDAEITREERERLQSALEDRGLFERRSRELDQHIRLFVDQIQDYAIFTMDTECRATSWNMGVSKVLGFEEAEFIGQDVRPLIFTPEANASGATANEFSVAAERGSASDDRWMMRKGQIRFWAAGITSSIRDEQNQLIGFSKVMRDMTAQKQNGDELSRLALELSEESRRKNEFLATLAHELRNPLSPIKNAVQLMEMMQLDGEVDDLRCTMARQVEQLVRLIDDLMDISRIGRGKLDLRKEFVSIKKIVDAAIEASLPLIHNNHQELVVKIEESNLVVDADPARMTQVVCNLLNNASKYSEANCKILLSASRENGNVEIRVKDNGNGISHDRLEEIFDMYSQLGESSERGTAGLGIGLALVRRLVELHGGTVKAYSDGVGQGSEFVVKVPAASQDAKLETTAVTFVSNAPVRSYRVLVVEDIRALAIVLSRLLSKMGHHVEMVENGQEAIEKLKTFDAEIIFSDISMPIMTGYELARHLRSNDTTSKIRLVAMTGYGQLSDREKAFAAGFDEHMTKPVDINRLRAFFSGIESS